MSFNIIETKERMEISLDVLKKEFSGLRTGRASVGLVEPIQVEAYGSKVPITQVSNISVPEPRMLTVQVWDAVFNGAVQHGFLHGRSFYQLNGMGWQKINDAFFAWSVSATPSSL